LFSNIGYFRCLKLEGAEHLKKDYYNTWGNVQRKIRSLISLEPAKMTLSVGDLKITLPQNLLELTIQDLCMFKNLFSKTRSTLEECSNQLRGILHDKGLENAIEACKEKEKIEITQRLKYLRDLSDKVLSAHKECEKMIEMLNEIEKLFTVETFNVIISSLFELEKNIPYHRPSNTKVKEKIIDHHYIYLVARSLRNITKLLYRWGKLLERNSSLWELIQTLRDIILEIESLHRKNYGCWRPMSLDSIYELIERLSEKLRNAQENVISALRELRRYVDGEPVGPIEISLLVTYTI